MTELAFHRVTAMPGSPAANAIYFVAPAARPNYTEVYVTGTSGSTVKRIINEVDVQALIDASLTGIGGLKIEDDITARDALSLSADALVMVVDASDDATVTSGAALYAWRNSQTSWTKISEFESLDLQLTWSALQGKPTSAVGDIDDAVSKRHAHSNKSEIDKVGQNGNGNLLYDGGLPKTGWDSEGW